MTSFRTLSASGFLVGHCDRWPAAESVPSTFQCPPGLARAISTVRTAAPSGRRGLPAWCQAAMTRASATRVWAGVCAWPVRVLNRGTALPGRSAGDAQLDLPALGGHAASPNGSNGVRCRSNRPGVSGAASAVFESAPSVSLTGVEATPDTPTRK
jgi:hypothetical protein